MSLTDFEKGVLNSHKISSNDVKSVSSTGLITFLDGTQRQLCECWTRVMGYYRPVNEFNIGKKSEFSERKYFIESKIA